MNYNYKSYQNITYFYYRLLFPVKIKDKFKYKPEKKTITKYFYLIQGLPFYTQTIINLTHIIILIRKLIYLTYYMSRSSKKLFYL